MKKASITEAKNRLSALIDGLKRGAPVLIVDRGRPVARLEPVTSLGEGEQDGRLSRLIREGIVRPARKPLSSSLFTACNSFLPAGTRLTQATKSGKRRHDFSASIRCVPPMRCNWPRPSRPPSGDQHHWK